MPRYKFKYRETSTTLIVKNDVDYLKVVSRILDARRQVEQAISVSPDFYTSLDPLDEKVFEDKRDVALDDVAFEVPIRMCKASKLAGVGPMAAVAGGIAHYSVEDVEFAVVDNGGDIVFKDTNFSTFKVGIFPSEFAIKLKVNGILSVCTSSGRYGHSISFGDADAATIVANNGFIADAFATALCNKIKPEYGKKEIEKILDQFWKASKKYIKGAIIIKDEFIGFVGDLEIVRANVKTNLITRG